MTRPSFIQEVVALRDRCADRGEDRKALELTAALNRASNTCDIERINVAMRRVVEWLAGENR